MRRVEAVRDVSFEVPTGHIFGFLGPNGAGKTTTIKMLTGLLAPTSGTFTHFGLRQLGYMSQLFSLYNDLTVDENIRFFAGLYEVSGARFQERRRWILDMAGLGVKTLEEAFITMVERSGGQVVG